MARTKKHTCQHLLGWRVGPKGERPHAVIYESRALAAAIARSERRHTRRQWVVYRVCTCPYGLDDMPPGFGGTNYQV